MTEDQILQAFNGRWRIKKAILPLDSLKYEAIAERVKSLCLDFFRAGCLLNQSEEEIEITPEDFERWWCSYDKKVGKEKAKKLWDKLSNKDKKACMEYTPAYVASTSEKQFRKNPETFLRNRSWNDEIIPRNNETEKQHLQQQRLAAVANRIAEYTKDAR